MLQPMSKSPRTGDGGSILALTLVISLVIALLIASAIFTATSMSRHAQYNMDQTEASALAEGVTEAAQRDMLTKMANFEPYASSGSVTYGSSSYPYTIAPVGGSFVETDPDGFNVLVQPYRINSTVATGRGSATINRIVSIAMASLFQYMIYYKDDLEILPGQTMTLGGRVHSNGSIYVGSGSTLTVDTDYFRSTREILRKKKSDGTPTGGTVNIKVNGEPSYVNMAPGDDSTRPDWLNFSNTTWKGTVQSGAHGVKEVSSPKIGSIKATDPATGQKGYYHQNAGLVIQGTQAFNSLGIPLLLPPGTIAQKSFYDGREKKNVTVTDVNVGLLNASGCFPANGLIYAYRTDASTAQPNGVRLSNGATLLAPLTVVSEDPLYIKGDFNTINKKGAAVIADAVNLLSNAWNDSKGAGTLPNALATQFNVAMVTGNVPTPNGGGIYSGGFENLPRLHENWAGKTLTIRGAFINMFQSEIAKAAWKIGGDVYSAPIRDWLYDPLYQDLSKMPPFTPNAVYLQRLLWDDGLPSPLFTK